MRKEHIKFAAAGLLIVAFMVGFGAKGTVINDGADGNAPKAADDSGYQEGEQENQQGTESQPQSRPQAAASEEELEKELAAYRAEREKGVSSMGSYEMVVAPNEENYRYGVGFCENEPEFDVRELTSAYKTARIYVEETLGLKSEVWDCADPRMNAIYEDEDKGVADGYEAENIFLCEYEDQGKWQYLILVREKKGSDWNVLYHGSSYKTEKNEGGDQE